MIKADSISSKKIIGETEIPDNYNCFNYSVTADFDTTGVVFQRKSIETSTGDEVYSKSSITIIGGRTIELANASHNDEGIYIEELKSIVYHTETADEEMYFFVDGNCRWLKEFYDVQLLVINKGDGAVTNGKAVFNVPEGLSLVNCEKEQKIDDLTADKPLTAH